MGFNCFCLILINWNCSLIVNKLLRKISKIMLFFWNSLTGRKKINILKNYFRSSKFFNGRIEISFAVKSHPDSISASRIGLSRAQCRGVPPSFISWILYIVQGPLGVPLALYPEYYILSRDQCRGVPPSFITWILHIVQVPM